MFEEALSLISIWASMNSWLTPTVLFVLLNVMIGTIAVTSAFTAHKPPSHHHHDHHLHHHNNHHQNHLQTQLTRSPSVLQRLKSLNFYSYIHTPQQPTTVHHQPLPTPPPSSTTAAVPIPQPEPEPEPEPEPQVEDHHEEEVLVDDENNDEGPTMEEIYSRITQKQSNPLYNRQKSDTKPTGGEIPVKLPAKIKKSASDKSAFNHFEAVPETDQQPTIKPMAAVVEERENAAASTGNNGGHEVDARADDFINRFRQQLKMQRMESVARYKEMIFRGSAK